MSELDVSVSKTSFLSSLPSFNCKVLLFLLELNLIPLENIYFETDRDTAKKRPMTINASPPFPRRRESDSLTNSRFNRQSVPVYV